MVQAFGRRGLRPPTFRIIPRKGLALFHTIFFACLFAAFAKSAWSTVNTVTVNGQVVVGEERAYVLLMMRSIVVIPALLFIWHARKLLPNSPFDFVELSPDGLTVGGLFGRRHRSWASIAGFSVGNVPLTNQPITWIKVESEPPLRFFMGGYVQFKLFSRMKTRMRAIASWLDLVRSSYVMDNAMLDLPPPPPELVGKIITLSGDRFSRFSFARRSGVIER